MTTKSLLLLLLIVIFPQSPSDSKPKEPHSLHEKLKAFEPMIGKTFRGEFADSTPEKPKFDVSRWERAMNGQAVRILHSVNDGEYGGETIMMWDPKENAVKYWYFTTAGFHTQGTMDMKEKEWSATEKVVGQVGGITEVKSTSGLTAEGHLKVDAQYLRNGKWEQGHRIDYLPAPDAKVIFR